MWDIMERAQVTIAVFDPEQVLRKSQEVPEETRRVLFASDRFDDAKDNHVCERPNLSLFDSQVDVANIRLDRQFRIDACEEIISWINDFAAGRTIGPIPEDTKARVDADAEPYDIRVFSSPTELYAAIVDRAGDAKGLSRLLATYDWPYKLNSRPSESADEYWSVSLNKEQGRWVWSNALAEASDMAQTSVSANRFRIPWNYQLHAGESERSLNDKDAAWAEKPYTLREVGSIYTIQGFDLNYAGVILGPSVQWRDGKLVFDPKLSNNYQAINGSKNPSENLRHELNVLLKRGVHGLYLFAVDHNLQQHLMAMSALGQNGELST